MSSRRAAGTTGRRLFSLALYNSASAQFRYRNTGKYARRVSGVQVLSDLCISKQGNRHAGNRTYVAIEIPTSYMEYLPRYLCPDLPGTQILATLLVPGRHATSGRHRYSGWRVSATTATTHLTPLQYSPRPPFAPVSWPKPDKFEPIAAENQPSIHWLKISRRGSRSGTLQC